ATKSGDIGGAARVVPAATDEAAGADAAATPLAVGTATADAAATSEAACAATCGAAVALAMVAVLPVENTLGVSTGGCGWGFGALASSSVGHLPVR
ncbi:hypothetical protein ACIKQ7_19570, partial [Acinetobacter baumannii]